MYCKPISLWEVGGFELNARFHQVRNESNITGEPIELSND
jgi:hypothetical protein